MATKSKHSGLSKGSSERVDDTSHDKNAENTENVMYMSNGGMMNGAEDNSAHLWMNSSTTPGQNDVDTAQKRLSHNNIERKRKEKIKKWISHIGALLPPAVHSTEKTPSTLETMERAAHYITELKNKFDQVMLDKGDSVQAEEIKQLKKELEEVKLERDNYSQVIKRAGIALDPQWKQARLGRFSLPNGEISESPPKDEEKVKGKSKRKNTVSTHLESKSQQDQTVGNMFSGMFGNQNVLLNSGFPNGNQVVVTPNGQLVMPMNQVTGTLPNGQNVLLDKSSNGLGLLQMAMQDAGITELSRQPSPESTGPREGQQITSTSGDTLSNNSVVSSLAEDPNHALQTLASVASNPQNAVNITNLSSDPPNKTTSSENMSSTLSETTDILSAAVATSMTLTSVSGTSNPTTSFNSSSLSKTSMPNPAMVPSVATSSTSNANVMSSSVVASVPPPLMSVGQTLTQQGNMMMNMPMNPGQLNLLPQNNFGGVGGMFMNQQGQLIMVNEQGVPVMAGVNNMPGMNNITGLTGLNNMNSVLPQQDQQIQQQPQQQQQQQQQQQATPSTNQVKNNKKDKNSKKPTPVAPNVMQSQSMSDQVNVTSVMTSQGQMNIIQPQQGGMNMLPPNILPPNMVSSIPLQGQPQVTIPGTQNVFQQQFPNQPLVQMASNNQNGQNQGIILPANQNGNLLTLNTVPNQPNQLPSALILPNGQVIPVVQNAQSLMNNQSGVISSNGQVVANNGNLQMPLQQMGVGMPNTVISNMPGMDLNNQMLLGNAGFPMNSQSSMGMMMPDQSANPQAITTSAQTISNNVVPTSSTQSIMTTQIQGTGQQISTQFNYQKPADGQTQISNSEGTMSILPRNPVQASSVRASVPELKGPQPPNASGSNLLPAAQPNVSTLSQGPQATPGPPIGPNGSILLTVPIDGQQMSVLVDPLTMQVLGRVPQPGQNNGPLPITPTTTTTTTAAPTPITSKKASGGKKAPRICPKPNQPSKKGKNKSPSPVEPAAPATSEANPAMSVDVQQEPVVGIASIGETDGARNEGGGSEQQGAPVQEDSAMDTGLSTEETADMTDILAKAAESIFSANASPPVGFYNPANEDNPLHIDTSAVDTEDDGGSSPSKAAKKNQDSTPKTAKAKALADDLSAVLDNMEPLLKSPEDALTMNLPSEEDFNHTTTSTTTTTTTTTDDDCTTPGKKAKHKNKVAAKEKEDTLDTPKVNKKSSKKKSKNQSSDESNLITAASMPEPSFDLPAEITFGEDQLSDVLDQVEKFDSSFSETPKKANKKKSKNDDGDLPASKKRKKHSSKDKGGSQNSSNNNSNNNDAQSVMDISMSMPVSQVEPASRMSIYDFQDDSPPEVAPARKGALNSSHSASKSLMDSHKIKETQSISDSFDDLTNVLSQTMDSSTKSAGKSPRVKSKSNKKKKSKAEVKQPVTNLENMETQKSESSAQLQMQSAMEENLNNLFSSQNIDLTPNSTNDIVPASLSKMIDPLEVLTSIASEVPFNDSSLSVPPPSTELPNQLPPPQSSQPTISLTDQLENIQKPDESPRNSQQGGSSDISKHPTSSSSSSSTTPSRSQMEPPPLTSSHAQQQMSQPQHHDSNKNKNSPYQSPASSQHHVPSKPSPSSHLTMHPSPQHHSQPQPPTVPLSHLPAPSPTHRSTAMLPPSDNFQTHKSPAHLSPAPSMMSPNMRASLDQSIVSPSNVPMGGPAREVSAAMRSNTDPNIISPPNVTMGTMQDAMNTSQDQNIVSPPNINLGGGRPGVDSHPGYEHPSGIPRPPVPEATPIFPPSELPCSNEPLFPSPIASIPKLSHIETSPVKPPSRSSSGSNSDGPSQRSRNSIYSAENFVQSSPSRSNDSRPSQDASQLTSCYGRSQSDNSSESFNFTSIGMNLTSNTSSNSLADGMQMSSSTTPFSFSLTPTSSNISSASAAGNNSLPTSHGHHPLSFYSPIPLPPPSQAISQPQENQPNPLQQASSGMNMLPLGVDLRNSRPHSRQMSNGQPNQNTFNFSAMEMNDCASREHNLPNMEKNSHPDFRGNNRSSKRMPDLLPVRSMEHGQGQRPHVNTSSPYFQSTNFNHPSSTMMTPPLRHPPIQSNDRSRLTHQPPYDPNFQPRGPSSSGPFSVSNRFDNNSNNSNVQRSGGGGGVHYEPPSNLNNQNIRKSNSNPPSGPPQNKPTKQNHQSSSSVPSTQLSMPTQNSASQSQTTPLNHRDMPNTAPPSQPGRQKSQSRKQNSKKNKPQTFNQEMEANLSHSIFDSNQGMSPYFSVPTLSPNPNRNLQSEGPSFLHGNLFSGAPRPLSNTGSGPKNSEIGGPFNPLFHPSRPQNTLSGLNFQTGFGMNHVSASSAPQITPHSGNVAMTPHLMSNFNLSNIFTDVNNSQSDSLNISPIKFPHSNHMLPQHGMDPNSLQHHHQNSALYHNRGHPGQQQVLHNAMAINSLLGHNTHGFDVRPMGQGINSSVGPAFHGAGHPGSFAIPPLNFSLHDSH